MFKPVDVELKETAWCDCTGRVYSVHGHSNLILGTHHLNGMPVQIIENDTRWRHQLCFTGAKIEANLKYNKIEISK